jgi:anti-sigma B factor antagonist
MAARDDVFAISQTTREAGGKTIKVLAVKGEIDSDTFGKLQRALEDIAGEAGPRVVLDCSKLEYISSAGLAVLKKMTREFRAKQGDVRLAALTPKVDNVVSLLGFSHVIRVFKTLDEAVDSYRA